jgi:hypothetical protein
VLWVPVDMIGRDAATTEVDLEPGAVAFERIGIDMERRGMRSPAMTIAGERENVLVLVIVCIA